MENARRITFFMISYTLLERSNFILMILLTNQWYLESQKPLVTLFMSKKHKREVSDKEKIADIMLGKER